MVKKVDDSLQEELTKLHRLIESENDSLDMHILDYFDPASEKMISHIDGKANYLNRFARSLQDLCTDNASIGIFDGIIDEIRDIKLELRNSMKGSLKIDPAVDPRAMLEHYTKIQNVNLIDLIKRLGRIQRILITSYSVVTNNDN